MKLYNKKNKTISFYFVCFHFSTDVINYFIFSISVCLLCFFFGTSFLILFSQFLVLVKIFLGNTKSVPFAQY